MDNWDSMCVDDEEMPNEYVREGLCSIRGQIVMDVKIRGD